MSVSYSATDFENTLGHLLREQERLSRFQVSMSDGVIEPKDILEQHARDYFINGFLSALNWHITSYYDADAYREANLGVEVKVVGDTTLRLDYLGFCRDTKKPLLVVEAKRPSLVLPVRQTVVGSPYDHPVGEAFADYLNGNQPNRHRRDRPVDSLTEEWCRHLDQLRDYASKLGEQHSAPIRVALTNGHWLVVFRSVENAFGTAATKATEIAVFEKVLPLSVDAAEMRELLDYRVLCRSVDPIEPVELPFAIDASNVQSCLHGVHVIHWTEPHRFAQVPRINVSPVLFLRSKEKTVLQVCRRRPGQLLPREYSALSIHLNEMENEAKALFNDAKKALGVDMLVIESIEEYFDDEELFEGTPAVRRVGGQVGNSYLLVTGAQTHWLRWNSEYEHCPYHEHAACNSESAAASIAPIVDPSVRDRSLSRDGDRCHCAHRDVLNIKRSAVTDENQQRCGPRSRGVGYAFCEVWEFEQRLCCRTCAFEPVCSRAKVFSAPCVPLTVQGNSMDRAQFE